MPIQFLPILIGAAATAGGIAINQNEINKANKRARRANELLRRNQKKFEEQANQNLITSVKKFGSQDREDLRNEVIQENVEVLGQSLGRDRGSFVQPPQGNVSNVFIDRRDQEQNALDERAERRKRNFARVLAPGGISFDERRGVARGQLQDNTIRTLQRGQLGVDRLKVDEAGRVRPNFLGDLLTGIGPAIVTGGALGAFPAATAPATSASVAASAVPSLATNAALGVGGATGLTGLEGLPLLATSLGPRRGFSRAN